MIGWLALLGYCATIPLANWFIGHVGVCSAHGPCLIPVLNAPSGVLWAGLAFTLRDLTQDHLGTWWTLGGIAIGGALSFAVSDPFVAVASSSAFLLSELADMAVYSPLRRRGWLRAVVASNVVGSVVDSIAFLMLAFGSLDFLVGQVIGKWLMLLPVVAWRCRGYVLPRHPSAELAGAD